MVNPYYTSLEYENVNGIKLMLNVYKRLTAPHSRKFVIIFKNPQNKKSVIGVKTSIFLAIVFNLLAFVYGRVNVTVIIITLIVLSFLVYFWFTHSVQSETLLVIPTVCIQSTVKYVWGRTDFYMAWPDIDDVIINEVIKMNRVLYYLTVLLKQDGQDATKLVPLFKYTKPRLVMLQKIYSEIQTFLMEEQTKTVMGCGDKG